MKDDASRWTNLDDEQCPECFAAPGEEHLEGCRTGNRDIAQDTPATRRTLAKVAKNAKAKADANKAIRDAEQELALQGYPKAVIRRVLEDLATPPQQLAKWDTAYAICRSAMGIPIQTDAFADESGAAGDKPATSSRRKR